VEVMNFVYEDELLDTELNLSNVTTINENLNYHIAISRLDRDVSKPESINDFLEAIRLNKYVILPMMLDANHRVYDVFCDVFNIDIEFEYVDIELCVPKPEYAFAHNLCAPHIIKKYMS
jgi:hypothetical protein